MHDMLRGSSSGQHLQHATVRVWLHALLSMPETLHARTARRAVHDLRRMPLVATISRFHIQILQLFAFVLIWVHWDACLQYGACAAQPASRWEACWPRLRLHARAVHAQAALACRCQLSL